MLWFPENCGKITSKSCGVSWEICRGPDPPRFRTLQSSAGLRLGVKLTLKSSAGVCVVAINRILPLARLAQTCTAKFSGEEHRIFSRRSSSDPLAAQSPTVTRTTTPTSKKEENSTWQQQQQQSAAVPQTIDKNRTSRLLLFLSVSPSSTIVTDHHISAQTESGRGCRSFVIFLSIQQ